MLSGSPVSMGLSVVLLLAALIGGALLPRHRPGPLVRHLVSASVVGAAAWLEIRLFHDGSALAVRAEPPFAYHAGLAALWWAAVDGTLRAQREDELSGLARSFAGLAGGLLVLGASASTSLHDFGPWTMHPVAALPLALWASWLLLPSTPFAKRAVCAVLPASLALAGLVLASSAATERLRSLFFPEKVQDFAEPTARAPEPGGTGTLGDGVSRRLPRESNVRFRHEILVRMKPHTAALFRSWSGPPLYLRTSTLSLFESDEILSPIRTGRWLDDLDDGRDDRAIPLDGVLRDDGAFDPGRLHTFYIGRESIGHLPLVGGSEILFLPSVYEFADDWYQISPVEGIAHLRYTASAPPGPVTEIQPADLTRPRHGEIPSIYLQLPPSPLPGRIAELCRDLDRGDPLAGIRRLLAERSAYALQFQTPEGSSPLAEFLFGHGRGHCEHYAAATVLMLRCLGIPSRVAYGYAGGIADAGQGVFAFRDSDFHAWAEILTPENEWKIFDTTPRVPSAAPRVSASATLPTVDDTAYHDLSDFGLVPVTTRGVFGELIDKAVAFLSRHFFLATAAGLGLFGGLWWLLPGRRESARHARDGAATDASGSQDLPGFLRELEQAAAALGLRRRPGQTWRELLARLAEQGPVPAVVHDAVAYHYRTAYAGRERDLAEEAGFREALRDWRDRSGTHLD